MDVKKIPAIIGGVVVFAALLLAYYARISTARSATEPASQRTGAENSADGIPAGK